jgi:16S rRNA (guanine(1405)-N(7))-methyltransferase
MSREADSLAASQAEQIAQAVLASPRYRHLHAGAVRDVARQEAGKYRTLAEAIKATKSKLHQVSSAYLDGRMEYARWLEILRAAVATGEQERIRAACAGIMRAHASTRERLPMLEAFYRETLGRLGPIQSVLDLGCGLNPLAVPWMPLAPDASYYACDLDAQMVAFLGDALGVLGQAGNAVVCNLLEGAPAQSVDVALALKLLPCLEQLEKTASLRLLESIQASYVIVSFPVQSLGGKHKGMRANYDAHFQELIVHTSWQAQRFAFQSELAFVLTKRNGGASL